MKKLSIAVSLFLSAVASGSFAQSKPQADMGAVTKAISEGDRDTLSDLLHRKSVTLPEDQAQRARLLLMERLAVLSQKDREGRREAASALLELFPEDKFVMAIAASNGIDVYSNLKPEQASPSEGAASETPDEPIALPWRFRNFLKDGNGKKLVEELLTADYVDQIPEDQRASAEDVVLQYVRPLPASKAQANRDGYKVLAALRPGNSAYESKAQRYEQAIAQKRASILRRMRKDKDEFNGTVFYEHPNQPRYTDTRSYLAVYAGERDGHVWLRMRLNYTSTDWLFIDSARFNIDGRIVPFEARNWKRDNDSEIWEWVDVQVDASLRKLLTDIAQSEKTVVRFNGQQYYKNVTIREADKQIIRDMFIVEEVLKEQASG